jgi:hypothetical protein
MSTILSDTFTDTVGTNLTAHAPDVNTPNPGGFWTQITGTQKVIAGNKDQCSSFGAGSGEYTLDAGQADYTLSETINFSSGDTGNYHGLICRVTDGNNHWQVVVDQGNGLMKIRERSGGSNTDRASTSVTINTGTDYTLQAVLSGTSITATLNGGNSINYGSMATGAGKTKVGIRDGQVNTMTHDNFLVTGASSETYPAWRMDPTNFVEEFEEIIQN